MVKVPSPLDLTEQLEERRLQSGFYRIYNCYIVVVLFFLKSKQGADCFGQNQQIARVLLLEESEWLFIHALSVIVEGGCSLYIKSVRSKESSQRNSLFGFFL